MSNIFLTIVDMLSCAVWYSFPISVLTMKQKRKWFVVLIFILNCIENISIRNIPELYTSPLKTIVYFSQFAIVIFMCFKEPVKQKVLAFFLFLVTLTVTDIMSLIFLSLLGIHQDDSISGISGSLITAVFCLVISYFALLVISLIFNKLKNKEITNKIWQFQIIIFSQMLFIFTIIFSIYANYDALDSLIITSPFWTGWITFIVVLAVAGDICLYRILITNSQNFELKKELEIMYKKNELELDYYQKLKQHIEETKKINHDINNILTVIQNKKILSDFPTDDDITQKIVDELKESLEQNRVVKYCENELVNLILISKSADIIQKNIEFSANVNIPVDINIKNSDLCRVFTNLLDNSKEACEMAVNKEKCFIVISASIKGDFLCISTENYCETPINKKKERLISAKVGHKGLGLEIVKGIAQNYSGECVYKFNDNVFTTVVSLKLS